MNRNRLRFSITLKSRKDSGGESSCSVLFHPTPTLDFLSKDFCLQPDVLDGILTKENLLGAKTAPTAISRTFTPLLRETRFP